MNISDIFKTPRKRSELPLIFNTNDREARDKIAELQSEYKIINLQDGRGYFIGNDAEGIKYSFQEIHRATSSFEKACNISAQCKIEDIADLERFCEKLTYCIGLLSKVCSERKAELYERKNIKTVPVRQHYRRIGLGNLEGQQKIEGVM